MLFCTFDSDQSYFLKIFFVGACSRALGCPVERALPITVDAALRCSASLRSSPQCFFYESGLFTSPFSCFVGGELFAPLLVATSRRSGFISPFSLASS